MPYKRDELAWAAGLFEGEGHVGATWGSFKLRTGERRMRSTPQLTLKIGMCDLEPLHRFQAVVGIGKVYGPYSKKREGERPYWHYSIDGLEKTQAVIALLWPWLSLRRRAQASRAFQALHRAKRGVAHAL